MSSMAAFLLQWQSGVVVTENLQSKLGCHLRMDYINSYLFLHNVYITLSSFCWYRNQTQQMTSELYSDSSAQSVSLCHLILFLQPPSEITLLKGHTAHKTQSQISTSELPDSKGFSPFIIFLLTLSWLPIKCALSNLFLPFLDVATGFLQVGC